VAIDRPEERGYQSTRAGWFYGDDDPPPDLPGWVDGLPTSGRDQHCAFCGSSDVKWIHPLAADRVRYREYGKGHTLPTFWTLCDRCEDLYAAGDDQAAIEVMRTSPLWNWASDEDLDERVRQPLAVFRRADKGARRLTT
jgi:hypothetical protein